MVEKEFSYPTREQIIEANRRAVSLSGDPFGILNSATLDHIASAVRYKYSRNPPEEALCLKAAFVFVTLAGPGHVFIEGNKRTAVSVLLSFLEANKSGIVPVEREKMADLAMLVACGKVTQSGIYRWLKERVKTTEV